MKQKIENALPYILHRHKGADLLIFSQTVDVDKAARQRAAKMFCKRLQKKKQKNENYKRWDNMDNKLDKIYTLLGYILATQCMTIIAIVLTSLI